MTYELMFRNIACLQSDLSSVVGYLPFAWACIVKFFIPPVILILFGLACDAENAKGQKVFGHYEEYAVSPYQVLGILCVVFTGFLFISSLIVPNFYSALQRPDPESSKGSSIVRDESGLDGPMDIDENEADTIANISSTVKPTVPVEVA